MTFRFKEAHAAWPLACLVWAVAIKWAAETLSAAFVLVRRRRYDAARLSQTVP